jgi:hydroxyacylglutathione hydrolase
MPITMIPVPAFKDNYMWLLYHATSHHAVVIDPGEAKPIIQELRQRNLELSAILVTHHHWDHTQGIEELLQYRKTPVYGPALDNIPFCNRRLQGDDIIHLPELDLSFSVMEIPGHTRGHIAYYGASSVFTGDTLFTGGCGRLFEGTAEQMYHSLNKIAALPAETFVFCGHEYTEQNLLFAKHVEPHNEYLENRIQKTLKLRAANRPTVPASLRLELQTNPFLRCHLPSVQQSVEKHCGRTLTNPIEVFAELRLWKDNFVN